MNGKEKGNIKVLFLTEGKDVPASRFRVDQCIDYIEKAGIKCSVLRSWPQKYYLPGWHKKRIIGRIAVYFYFGLKVTNGLSRIMRAPFYDVVFLQRDLLSWKGSPFLECLLRKLSKKIIFDLDDAIFTNKRQKISKLIGLSDLVIVGNSYLREYAQRYNSRVEVIPTSVDTDKYSPLTKKTGTKIIIGWMGTSSNLSNLEILSRPLSQLSEKYEFKFKVVSNFPPRVNFLNSLNIVWRRWEAKKELEELQSFDIGVMPLVNNEWTRGKCGFKALLCMTCGIPVVISPVGVNREIVQNGINGFLADTEEEWIEKLSKLIDNKKLRKELGKAARRTVVEKYSIKTNLPKVLDVFKKVRSI